MHDQILAARKPRDKVFRTPFEARDPLPDQALGKALRKWKPEIRPPRFQISDAPSDEHRSKPAADGFDFRKFGNEIRKLGLTLKRADDSAGQRPPLCWTT
jgi:hypothetical protein